MARLKVDFKGDVKALKVFMNKRKFKKLLDDEIGKATIKNSLILVAEIKTRVQQKKFKKNARVTQLIKGSNKPPIVDSNDLLAALQRQVVNSFKAVVGYTPGTPQAELAQKIQKGFKTKITPEVRAAIFGKLKEAGVNIDSLADRRTRGVLQSSKRPFLDETFRDFQLQETMRRNWKLATRKFLKKASKGKAPSA